MTNSNSRIILTLYITALSMGLAYGSHAPLIPVFARDVLKANYTEIGFIGMANYLPYAFFPFLVGLLLDRISKLIVLLIGISMATASIAMLTMVDNISTLLLLRAVSGIAHAFFWPSAEAMISSINNNEGINYGNEAKLNGSRSIKRISGFTMTWVMGYMIGPLLGSYMFNFGYAYLFLYSSLMILPSLACITLLLRLHTTVVNSKNVSIDIKRVRSVVRDRFILILMIIYYSASFAIVLSILPSYMNDNSIDEQSIGLLFFIFGVARLVTLTIVHRLAGHKGIVIANIAIAVAMLMAYTLTTLYSLTLSMIAFGFAFSIYFPVTLSMITKGIPSNLIGSVVGLYETIFGIGWASAPLVSGVIADVFGINTPYLLMSILGLALALAYILTVIRYKVN